MTKEWNELNNPVCFKRQYGDKLELHINTYKRGHRTLLWYIENQEGRINTTHISSPDIILSGIKQEGVYYFTTIGEDAIDISATVSMYFDYLDAQAEFDAIARYADNIPDAQWAATIIDKIVRYYKKDQTKPITFYIWQELQNENLLTKEEELLFKIMMAAEYYLNTKNLSMNYKLDINPKLLYGARLKYITALSSVQLKTYSIDNNGVKKLLFKQSDNTLGKATIIPKFNENQMHEMVVSGTEGILNYFYHYQFGDNFLKILWSKTQSDEDQDAEIIANRIMTEVSTEDFTDEEAAQLKLELSKKPYNFFLSRVLVEDIDDNYIEIEIPDYELIAATKKKFYVASKEEDLLNEQYSGKLEEITASTIKINKVKHYLGGNTFFFIEDEAGNIVSPLTRYSFDEIIEEYNDKVRVYNYDLYKKRLMESIRRISPRSEMFIADSIARHKSDRYSNVDRANVEVMSDIVSYYQERNLVDDTLFAIMEDWSKNFNYHTDFLNKPVEYYYSEDKLVFPDEKTAKKQYVIVMHYTYKGMDTLESKYLRASSAALEISTKPYDKLIMYVIDLSDYHRSGYFILNNENNIMPKFIKSNIEIERMSAY